jgi:hypothetical protein
METDQTYNGWTNRETWACSLWLSNDHGLYDMVNELAEDAEDAHALADAIKDLWEQFQNYEEEFGTPPNKEMIAMLLEVGSDYRIDWDEIATNWLED